MSWSWTESSDKYVIQPVQLLQRAGRGRQKSCVPMCSVSTAQSTARYSTDQLNTSGTPPHVHGPKKVCQQRSTSRASSRLTLLNHGLASAHCFLNLAEAASPLSSLSSPLSWTVEPRSWPHTWAFDASRIKQLGLVLW